MTFRLPICAGMPATGWFAAGLAFLAIGVRQPAFLGIGAAWIALGLRQHRRGPRP